MARRAKSGAGHRLSFSVPDSEVTSGGPAPPLDAGKRAVDMRSGHNEVSDSRTLGSTTGERSGRDRSRPDLSRTDLSRTDLSRPDSPGRGRSTRDQPGAPSSVAMPTARQTQPLDP